MNKEQKPNVADYWSKPPVEQDKVREQVKPYVVFYAT